MAKARSLTIAGLQAAIVEVEKPKGVLWEDKSKFPKKDGSLRLAFKRGSLYECRSQGRKRCWRADVGLLSRRLNAHR